MINWWPVFYIQGRAGSLQSLADRVQVERGPVSKEIWNQYYHCHLRQHSQVPIIIVVITVIIIMLKRKPWLRRLLPTLLWQGGNHKVDVVLQRSNISTQIYFIKCIFNQIYVNKHVKHISPIPYIYQISNSTNSRYISFHIFRLWSMFWWSRKLTCPRPRKAARWGERFRSKKWQTACARKSFCCNWATGWWWWWWWCQHCQPASTPPALSSFSWWKPALCSQSTSWEAIESWKMCLKCWKPTKVQTKLKNHLSTPSSTRRACIAWNWENLFSTTKETSPTRTWKVWSDLGQTKFTPQTWKIVFDKDGWLTWIL